jgi:hypothetical protein
MSVLILAFSRILKMEFVILNLPMKKNHGFYDIAFLVKLFWQGEISQQNWVETLTRVHLSTGDA